MKKIILSIALVTFATQLWGQVGIGTNTPSASSMLEVKSTDKGILFPRMSSTQRNAITAPVVGLYVFDTNTNSLWYYNGSLWINTVSEANYGDVKSGFQNSDHSGWIKLDGRAVTSLNSTQRAVAISLGFTSNLPDATSAYLVQETTGLGTVSGTNTTTLTQANLPNVNFTGTAANAGGHSHTGTTNTDGLHTHSIYDPGHAHTQTTVNDDFNNSGANPPGFTSDSAGSRTWSNINSSTTGISIYSNGNHSHTIATTTDGTHSHTVAVASGGSATPIDISPKSLIVNMFVYLGQ